MNPAAVLNVGQVVIVSNRRRALTMGALFLVCAFLAGCRSLEPQNFAAALPRFEPEKFFEGPVRSWGVIETRSGNPRSRFRADLMGHRDGSDLVITQDFTFEDGRTLQRIWRMRRLDEHRYEASAADVIGPSVGYAFGNTFHWEYTLELRPGNALSRVRMEHWMYLLGDGETMLNRVVTRKFGLIVAQTTEHFQRGVGPVPSIDDE